MRGCSTLPTNLLHGWPVMGTPNRSTSKRLIPPSRSAGRATIASRDRHSSTLIAHRPNQHHPRISDASIDAHRLMLKFQIFLASSSETHLSPRRWVSEELNPSYGSAGTTEQCDRRAIGGSRSCLVIEHDHAPKSMCIRTG